jgi:cytochrome c oxidase assembly factor CtaG
VSLVLLVLAVTYTRGWRELRRQGGDPLAPRWRLAVYLTGLATIAVALISPIDFLATRLLTAHMVQHQLLQMIAPPLLLLGNPFPFSVWGLPRRLRRDFQPYLVGESLPRQVLRGLTRLPVAGLLYALTLWGWHWPPSYEAALRHPVVHDLEHLSFFVTAVLFWWPIVDPAPHARGPRGGLYYGLRIAYLVLATAQNTLLGALIGLTERVLYPTYLASAGTLFGFSALEDQSLAGGLMWSAGHMYLIAILALLWLALDAENRGPASRPLTRHPRAGS